MLEIVPAARIDMISSDGVTSRTLPEVHLSGVGISYVPQGLALDGTGYRQPAGSGNLLLLII